MARLHEPWFKLAESLDVERRWVLTNRPKPEAVFRAMAVMFVDALVENVPRFEAVDRAEFLEAMGLQKDEVRRRSEDDDFDARPERELAITLAALRLLQANHGGELGDLVNGQHFDGVADRSAVTMEEIDRLCERLNGGAA